MDTLLDSGGKLAEASKVHWHPSFSFRDEKRRIGWEDANNLSKARSTLLHAQAIQP